VIPKKEIMGFRKGIQKDESMDRSCIRSYVIVPRCSHGFQDPGHKTPSQGFKILIPIQGYIQDYDMARYGASVISELTRSGPLTRLASDLGQARQEYPRTVHMYLCTVHN
jgi:hypothetical protein